MYSKKPEFIDPEEKKHKFFSQRKKDKKGLLKNQEHSKKNRRFLIFESSRSKIIFIMVYLFIVASLFIVGNKKKEKNNFRKDKIIYKLDAYLKTNNQLFAQLLMKNDGKKDKIILIKIIEFSLLNRKDEVILKEKSLLNSSIRLKEKGIKKIKKSFFLKTKTTKVKATFYLDKQKVQLFTKIQD